MTASEAKERLEWLYDEGHSLSVETKEALEAAIEALEKQIPKKPVEGYVFREKFREYLQNVKPDMAIQKGSCCPSCGEHIGEGEMTLKKKNGFPFCKWCGQAIDWSEG